jgi:hypothetical protein
MQINFYMSDADKQEFHDYVFSRGGYITPEVSPTRTPKIFRSAADGEIDFFGCWICLEDVLPSSKLAPKAGPFGLRPNPWLTPYQGGYFVHGPHLEYMPCQFREGGIVRGRIYDGLLTDGGTSYSDGDAIWPDGTRIDRAASVAIVRRMENFYRSMAAFIRKRYRNDGGWYHGPDSDRLELAGVPKYQCITEAGPAPSYGNPPPQAGEGA